jgi:hypothetical protein
MMECKVIICDITDEDLDLGHLKYHYEMWRAICDGIWNMDQCLSREDIEQIGTMLIKMARERDCHEEYPDGNEVEE